MRNYVKLAAMAAIVMASVMGAACSKDEKEDDNNDGGGTTTNAGVVINGVKWATCNVDSAGTFAASPDSLGKLYQWNRKTAWAATGAVSGWDDSNTSGDSWEVANDPSPAGWRLPTHAEQQSLLDTAKVSNVWTIQNGVPGRKFTDKATNQSLFLPAVGGRYYADAMILLAGTHGQYWSSTADGEFKGYILSFANDFVGWSYDWRRYGFPVRSVAKAE
jgi:uncharacterized protein (TIGR02145 family)